MRLYLSSFGLGAQPEALLSLLAGPRVAIIANAADHKTPDGRVDAVQHETNFMRSLDLDPTEIDLRSYFGQPGRLASALADFDGVWVRGGNSFNLRRAYRQSGADQVISERVRQGTLVYAGYSAGPAVLAPSLKGLEIVDDPNAAPSGYESPIVWEGLGLVPFAFAPHYKSDHPESESVDRLVEYFVEHKIPHRPLRDGEAIVINGDETQIVGHPLTN